MSSGGQHLRSLTAMRFFAAALVAVYHAGIQSSRDLTQHFTALTFGYLGVTFFFVLSGFVLVWSAQDGDTSVAFYRRRFARVWPLHALTLTVTLTLIVVGVLPSSSPQWSVPINYALLQSWWTRPDVVFAFNGPSWSLSNEVVFYACFPVVIALMDARRARWWLTGGVAWLLVGGVAGEMTGTAGMLSAFPVYRIGEFVVGMGLARMLVAGWRPRVSLLVAVAVMIGTYGALLAVNDWFEGSMTTRQWVVVLAMLPSISAVISAAATRDLAGEDGWLRRPSAVKLGQWSFALYLVHEILLRLAHPWIVDRPMLALVVVAAAVITAAVCYEWFEKPLERRLRGRRAHTPAQLAGT